MPSVGWRPPVVPEPDVVRGGGLGRSSRFEELTGDRSRDTEEAAPAPAMGVRDEPPDAKDP
jgi:hypothetical protein